MIYSVKPPQKSINASISLPASKSISNRVLLIRAMCTKGFEICNLSDCDDTRVMQCALQSMPETIDVEAAGTSMRFLTAFLAQREGEEHIITGSDRMKRRPIRILVDALRSIGADIEYLEQEGYPPLKIRGRKLHCHSTVEMEGNVSSQYISAMLMIGPKVENGLTLQLVGEVASRPYILMTLSLMESFGANCEWNEGSSMIKVKPGDYTYARSRYQVEPDWSAAAFWLEILTIRGFASYADQISFPGLFQQSIQGDSVAIDYFGKLHPLSSSPATPGRGKSWKVEKTNLSLDFTDCPDLAQAMVVAACLSGHPFVFTGLESLHIKETDRIFALKRELAKLGYQLRGGEDDGGELIWQHGTCRKQENPLIETYKDHRMAMAFAPACIQTGEIRIENPEVVSKSYPHFWDDLKAAGFIVEEEQA